VGLRVVGYEPATFPLGTPTGLGTLIDVFFGWLGTSSNPQSVA
jgi:hypothetical protein